MVWCLGKHEGQFCLNSRLDTISFHLF
jgi:hypothetical protein